MPDLFPDHPDVTFRQLLSHTSGAPNGTQELLATQITDPTSLEQLQAALSRDYTPQQHIDTIIAAAWTEPGTMLYSNAGYVALGMLLEEQNQRPLSHLLRTRIFKPAGLHHTRYATEASLPGAALHEDAWMGEADGWLELEDFDPDLFGAAGAVVGTTEDLNDFTRASHRTPGGQGTRRPDDDAGHHGRDRLRTGALPHPRPVPHLGRRSLPVRA